MRIVVASHNPVKLGAVERAFRDRFDDVDLDVVPVTVPSGVAEQPMSDAETRTGALHRVNAARRADPDADYWVGLEGGLEWIGDELYASAWMAVADAHGRYGRARTPTLPLPPEIRRLVRDGLELGDANDRVFGTRNSKQAGGAFGLLTGNRLTRESVYAEAVSLALVPLLHPLWRGTGAADPATPCS